MAAVNPPFVIQDQSHPSDDFRRMVKMIREAQGVANPGDLAVTQNGTPNMSVNVASGLVVIDGTQDATHQGSYVCLNDATTNLAISAADPTNPRIDIVVAKVQDTQYSGATDAWSLAVVTGTPAPSPTPPAAPVNSIVLAQVAVAALATSIINANITDTRTFEFNSQYPLGSTGAALGVPSAALGRFIGGWTTFGAPGAATFPYVARDYGFDGNNALWVCVAGGSPGTWRTDPMGTLPGGYASTTTAQTGIGSTITDLTNLSVTVTVGSGRRIRVRGYVGIQQQTSTGSVVLSIREGSTQLQTANEAVAAGNNAMAEVTVILQPSAGSHTYKLSLSTTAGTVNTIAGITLTCFLIVEDIGV